MKATIEEIANLINMSRKVAIFSHTRPDGDTLGSSLSLYLHLKDEGKSVTVFDDDPIPAKFDYIPCAKKVKAEFVSDDYDTFISVDCASLDKMGKLGTVYSEAKNVTKLSIDHHETDDGSFADYSYVDIVPANCQTMTRLFLAAGWEITPEIAKILLTGIITDTGNFTHDDVTRDSYECAAILAERGASPNEINFNCFDNWSLAHAQLYEAVIGATEYYCDGQVAVIVTTRDLLNRFECSDDVTEGFVDFALKIGAVKVSIAILEIKTGGYKISFRAKKGVNVAQIAKEFGGGGHELASGCSILAPLDEVKRRVVDAVSARLI